MKLIRTISEILCFWVLSQKNKPRARLSAAPEIRNWKIEEFFLGKIGCPTRSSSRNSPILDIIKFFQKGSPVISDEIGVLHGQGMSISDISARTGLKRYSVWMAIKQLQKRPRAEVKVPYDRWRKGKKRTGARPPFGFCFLEGELVRDPREYSTLLLIFNLWTRGTSITSIVNLIDERRLRSRTGKAWSYRVVQSITKRFESKELDMQDDGQWFSDEFLKGHKIKKSKPAHSKKGRGDIHEFYKFNCLVHGNCSCLFNDP